MACFILLVLLMMCLGAQGQVPNPVCINANPGKYTPNIKIDGEFSVRVEAVTQEMNRVVNIHMYYSQPRNQIRLSMLDGGVKSDMYFYFANDEILIFDYSTGRGSCTVKNLTQSEDTFIVGGVKDGKVQVPLTVLHLTGQSGFRDEIGSSYIGVRQVRDMDVDAYNSCQQWKVGSQSAIVNVTHYFSNKTWSRPDPQVVPVMVELHGSAVLHSQTAVDINHYYNYFDFQTSVDATVFETPPGIMCQGRNASLPFPNLPTYMKFSGETIDPDRHYVSYFEEIYDADDDFVVVRSQAITDTGTQGGMNRVTIIRDYPTGLTYTIDTIGQFCTIQNITAAPVLPVDFINRQGKVQEVTPDQLFYKSTSLYEYLGERNVRGIIADTWVTRTNVPIFPNEDVTVEWYFAKSDVTSWNDGSAYYKAGKYRMPVLCRMWHNDSTTSSIDMNIYHVDFTRIMYGVLDIRDCYPNSQSNYMQIVMNGAKELVMNTNIEQFKWAAALKLAEVAGIRWIRISDLKVYYDSNDAVIEFEILDAPPYAGDINGPPPPAISLQDATQKLQSAILSGQFKLNVWNSTSNTLSTPIQVSSNSKIQPNNAPSDDNSDDGYSAGAMAGLGVAMTIIGGAGGGVAAHFLIK